MGFKIEDGKGSGVSAKVNGENQLCVESVQQAQFAHHSQFQGLAFGTGSPSLTGTTTGGRYLYIKNTSATKNLFFQHINYFYDGGATNSTKTCDVQIFWNDSAPTANHTLGGAGNLNRSSANAADVLVYYWDEVGDGMTTVTPGTAGSTFKVAKGREKLDSNGAIILGPGDSISFNAKPIEIGEIGFVTTYYFKDK